MTTSRKGFSDTKLNELMKIQYDDENLDNFLPNFLIKDMNCKDQRKSSKEEFELTENDKKTSIFDSIENDDLNEYLRQMSVKENVDSQNISGGNRLRAPRSKFFSGQDLKQYAQDQKSQIFTKFQNQMNSQMVQNNGRNNNPNFQNCQNLSPQPFQNIQNLSPQPQMQARPLGSPWGENKSQSPYINYAMPFPGDPQYMNSPTPPYKIYSQSPNDSGNFSLGEDYNYDLNFISMRPQPKRIFSSQNLDIKKTYIPQKMKTSLFITADKEEKGEDFADVQELLDSITMDLWDYSKTQKGSRNLQKLLNKIQPEGLDLILEKLKNNFPELMIDTYGNYFCQKLIQSCSAEQRMFILKHIMKEFSEIACNPSGTHALQSLIEIINMPGEEELVKECVRDDILKLSCDINGTHVIQKVITCISENDREFINDTVLNNINKLVFDSNGICVLKKFINANKSPSLRKILLDEITKNALEIVQNPFGNYVIQHILDEWGPDVAKDIIDVIINSMISLSMQKFSSNVVEKCFDLVDKSVRKRMVKELFNAGKISSLLKNKYGNFVLQKAISVMSKEEKKEVRDYLTKRVNFTSNKEKARLLSLIEII